MSRSLVLLLGISLVLATTSCSRHTGQSAEFFVFGTLVEVRLPDANASEAAGIFGKLQREFQRMHREWHAWEPGELVSLNSSLQAGEWAGTTPDILHLIRQSQFLESKSGGHFNPAIGKLIALWGFHTSNFPIEGPPPSHSEIRILVDAAPSSLDIVIEGDRLSAANPQLQLDFGGIAKGYAIDLAIEVIRQSGQHSAIVNAGGDLRAIGNHAGEPWRVGVKDTDRGIAGGMEVSGDVAVFTSGNYTRFRQDTGKRYAHILDPRTGWPVESVAAATVIADNGTIADAVATAIMVAGDEDWPKVAASMGVSAAMVIDESGVIYTTRKMTDFLPRPRGGRSGLQIPSDGFRASRSLIWPHPTSWNGSTADQTSVQRPRVLP